jgi:hypothetical protein
MSTKIRTATRRFSRRGLARRLLWRDFGASAGWQSARHDHRSGQSAGNERRGQQSLRARCGCLVQRRQGLVRQHLGQRPAVPVWRLLRRLQLTLRNVRAHDHAWHAWAHGMRPYDPAEWERAVHRTARHPKPRDFFIFCTGRPPRLPIRPPRLPIRPPFGAGTGARPYAIPLAGTGARPYAIPLAGTGARPYKNHLDANLWDYSGCMFGSRSIRRHFE